jgi:hypothetical protein
VIYGVPMDTLPCGHVALEGDRRLCRHLLGERPDEPDTFWVLRGVGMEYDLCCGQCARAGQDRELVIACEGCVDRAGDHWPPGGVIGEPEIRRRPEPVSLELSRTLLPAEPVDIAPLDECPAEWLVLTAGQLLRWHSGSGEVMQRWEVRLPATDPQDRRGKPPRYRLHASQGGEFAVIAVDYGQHGIVIDLATGRVSKELDRGYYHVEQTPFPVAFLHIDGQLLLVHATEWNRVDLSDPATGVTVTPREFEAADRECPAHYLDYFYGSLHPSPDGSFIASDGWVWHPVGVPRVWDARQWRHDDVYEPEDGQSAHDLRGVEYYWDKPMAWVDGRTLAISGIGTDDQAMIPGVELYDAKAAAMLGRFAGPAGQMFCDHGRLYSAGPEALQIWDVRTGDNTGTVPGFTPSRYHAGSHELAAIDGHTLTTWYTR